MKNKFLMLILAICFVMFGSFFITACSFNNQDAAVEDSTSNISSELDNYNTEYIKNKFLELYSKHIEKLTDINSYKETIERTQYDGVGFNIGSTVENRQFYNDGEIMKYYINDTQASTEHFYKEVKIKDDYQYEVSNYDLRSKTYTVNLLSYAGEASRIANEFMVDKYNTEYLIKMEKILDDSFKFYFADDKYYYNVTFANSMIIEDEFINYYYTEATSYISEYLEICKGKITYTYNTGDFEVDVSECQLEV